MTDRLLKRLSPRERDEPEAIARRRSEATLLEKLSSSGITPRLLERGEDSRGPWHTMERVAFPTLAERCEAAAESCDGRTIAPDWIERAVPIAYRALAVLHEASDEQGRLKIIHADLSPANIAVDDAPTRVVLLDLDLAIWRDRPARLDGAFRGTVGYVAPEVARGEAPTVASDLFALAAAFVHAATGRPLRPTEGAMPFAALLAIAAEEPVDAALDALALRGPGHVALVRCLAHDASRRPSSARDVATSIGP